jgi:sugar lactone lactonase YvrE
MFAIGLIALQFTPSFRLPLALRIPRKVLPPVAGAFALALLLPLFTLPANAQNLTTFPVPVTVGGTPATQTVVVTVQQSGTPASIAVLTQGDSGLDFTRASGGTCATGFAYTAGQTCTVNVTFTPISPGQRSGAVILRSSSGSALATEYLSGSATGPLAVFVPGTITTVAGNTAWIYSGDGGAATNSSIFLPFGVAVDAAGNIFIVDNSNNRIRKVSIATGFISTIAGTGFVGATGDGGPATQATISGPSTVALDGAGNVFFSDTGNNAIRRIDAGTGLISTVAGTLAQHGYTGDGGLAAGATLNTPNGIALDTVGNLYIADTGNHTIRKVNAATGIITTIAGVGSGGFSGDGGLAVAATLNNPWGVSVSAAGEIYIADQSNQRIRKIAVTGLISTIAGNGQNNYTGDQGLATAAALNYPAAAIVDTAGNVYISDSGNNRIRKISAATGIITTVAGGGSSAGNGDGAAATSAGIYGPYSLALDSAGSLLIADVFDNRIRKVSSNVTLLQYSAIRVGRVSSPQNETVENDGNAPLGFTAFNAVSNSKVDSSTTTCATSGQLAVLASCVVGSDFAPTVTGSPVNGSIDVISSASNAPSIMNLAGNVLDIDPTTISLSSSANPANFGATITFSVNVASAGSTPTGTVTLLDGSSTLASTSVNSGGNATFAISTLAVGNHSITASYSGDSSNASSVSSTLVEVVRDATAPTTTTLIASANPAQAGATLRLTATLSVPAIDQGEGSPTGNVTFLDGSTTLGTAPLSGGIATFSTSSLAVGAHTITASYAGVTGFGPSNSAPLVVNIQLATSSAALATSANPVTAGAPLGLTATLSSTGGTPTGSVSFLDGSTLLGTGKLNGQGIASLSLSGSTLAVGSHSLTVTYAGDSDNGASVSAAVNEVVKIAASSTVIASSANPAFQGASVQFTATVTSNGGGTPTGTVQFFDGAASLGSTALNGSGIATLSLSTLSLGSHPITAVYSGDSFDATSSSTAMPEVIQAASATVALGSSANPSVFNTGLTFNIAVQGSGSQPSGTVILLDGATPLATLTLSGTGTASYTTSALSIGAHSLTAQYSGDVNHTAVTSAALSQNIVQATTTALTASSTQSIAGTSVQYKAVVTGSASQPVTGTVNFTDGGHLLAAATLDQTGTATYSTSTLAVGQHSIAAAYLGNALNQASASSPIAEQVQSATTVTTLASSANPSYTGTPLTLSSTVTGNGGAITGSIAFKDGASVLSVVPLSSTGTASLTISTLSAGVHTLTAAYSGDADNSISVSSSITQKIQQQTVVALTSSANPSLLLNNVTISVAVTNGVPAAPTGSVTLVDGSTVVGSATLSGSGTANFTLASPAVGTHVLTATYAGDSQNLPATSPSLSQVVTLRPTTNSFTTTANAISFGQTVTLISIVQGSGPNAPTGVVTFTSGSIQLGTATLSSTGIATLTVEPATGTYSVVASYPGDTLYAASTSSPLGITVGPTTEFAFTMTPASLSVQSGQHGSLQVDISTASTFKDTLNLGCAGLPTYATCTFSSSQVAVSGGQGATVTVTVDTGNPLGSGSQAMIRTGGNSAILACMLPGSALFGLLLFRARKHGKRLGGLLMLLILCGIGSLTGCGASFQQQATPAGTYHFQIVGSGANTGATASGTVALTVTQ